MASSESRGNNPLPEAFRRLIASDAGGSPPAQKAVLLVNAWQWRLDGSLLRGVPWRNGTCRILERPRSEN
ncbi:hypothetical protein TNCV_2649461 [Trichonephila clavipes]|nr:hypothetical protein TNCV_2649461 [Trichonephila clavipes]